MELRQKLAGYKDKANPHLIEKERLSRAVDVLVHGVMRQVIVQPESHTVLIKRQLHHSHIYPGKFLELAGVAAGLELRQQPATRRLVFDLQNSIAASRVVTTQGFGYGNPPVETWREDYLAFVFKPLEVVVAAFSQVDIQSLEESEPLAATG